MRKQLLRSLQDAASVIIAMQEESTLVFMEQVAKEIALCYQNGNKVLIAGNGGSLCDAMHFAEELTGFFRAKRKPLPAIALSDPSHITCVSNDDGFEKIFARHLDALGQTGDIFIALSTSGNSKNLIEAVKLAKQKQIKTISFLGKEGGTLLGMSDLQWVVTGKYYSDRIQEAHMCAMHIIIEMVENYLQLSSEENWIHDNKLQNDLLPS